MTSFKLTTIGLMAVFVFAGLVSAQKKAAKKTVPKKTTTVSTVKVVPPLEVRAAREKVDAQLANVNRFVDVLGPIAQGIETLDASAKTKPLPKTTADKNTSNKLKVVEAIRNLKAGLTVLESEFRTKTALQKYLLQIQGITDLASDAEDAAIAGKFVASKDPLREVSKKLTDTLNVLPL